MLFTGGQISMTISSCVVFVFTSLLFLSGYVLQQQTVRSLQAVIKPVPSPSISTSRTPTAPTTASSTGSGRAAIAFGDADPLDLGEEPQGGNHRTFLSPSGRGGRGKFAYVQLVADPVHVCNAIMLFAELQRSKNKAARLLLYPRIWDQPPTRSDEVGNEQGREKKGGLRWESTRRLLRTAAEKFNVVIRPIDPLLEGADASSASSYPLTILLSLTVYRRVIHLPSSGLLLDPSSLDRLFGSPNQGNPVSIFPPPADHSTLSATLTIIPPSVLLVQPCKDEFTRRKEMTMARSSESPDDLLFLPITMTTTSTSSFTSPPLKKYSRQPMILQTGTLLQSYRQHEKTTVRKEIHRPFNATELLKKVAYVHILDRDLPGPEYDIPSNLFSTARSSAASSSSSSLMDMETQRNDQMEGQKRLGLQETYGDAADNEDEKEEVRKLWGFAYDRFREDRRAVCGLDLEPWSPPSPSLSSPSSSSSSPPLPLSS